MQIHIDVDPAFWNKLHKATEQWPERQRGQASISRYALNELYCEIQEYGMGAIKAPAFGTGQHVQVKSTSEDDEVVWQDLTARFGSSATALKAALAFLYDSLVLYGIAGSDPSPSV